MLDVNLRRLGCCQIHRFAPRHSCSLETAPGLNEFVGAVIRAMDSHTDLSTQFFNNSKISQKLLAELALDTFNRQRRIAEYEEPLWMPLFRTVN